MRKSRAHAFTNDGRYGLLSKECTLSTTPILNIFRGLLAVRTVRRGLLFLHLGSYPYPSPHFRCSCVHSVFKFPSDPSTTHAYIVTFIVIS